MLRKQAHAQQSPSGGHGGASGAGSWAGGASGSGGSGGASDRERNLSDWPSGKSRTRVTTTLRKRLLHRVVLVCLCVGVLLFISQAGSLGDVLRANDRSNDADEPSGLPPASQEGPQATPEDPKLSLRALEEDERKHEEIASLGLPTDEVVDSSVAAKVSLLEEQDEREAEDDDHAGGLPGSGLDHTSEDEAEADVDAGDGDSEPVVLLLDEDEARPAHDGADADDEALLVVDHGDLDVPDANVNADANAAVDEVDEVDEAFAAEVAAAVESKYDGVRMVLKEQIVLPKKPIVKSLNAGQNFWPWYKILRKRGWARPTDGTVPDLRANLLLSKGRVPYLRPGRQMLNSIGLSGCIGGSKTVQLECRQQLARHHGCDYHDLHIQPAQYSMEARDTCESMLRVAFLPENAERMWMYKPSNTFHGKGLQLFRGPAELASRVAHCKSPSRAVVMEYIEKPATMRQGFKFDLRSYLLVASLDPQLVFYADAFARKSDKVYDADDKRTTVHVTNSIMQKKQDHFFSFAQVDAELQKEMGFPADYLRRAREYMKNVSLYVFKTTDVQTKPLSKAPGRFHLFAIDWIIDATGSVHLLEGNGYPLVTEYPIPGLTPQVWEDLLDLVLKIHVEPHKLGPHVTVRDKFTHGKWSLIYNQLEEQYLGDSYNPCYSFPEHPLV